jgi:hypothetical protein
MKKIVRDELRFKRYLVHGIGIWFFLIASQTINGQSSYLADGDYKKPGTWIFRSGLTGGAGMSILHLSNELRPSEVSYIDLFEMNYDLFLIAGAVVTVQPGFLSRRWAFLTEPAFAKYSYGDDNAQFTGGIETLIDIDIEMLRFPLAVQYKFANPQALFVPFAKTGYVFSYIVDGKAIFDSHNSFTREDFQSHVFSFSTGQNSLFFSLGSEVNIGIGDLFLELVYEIGDGIHSSKQNWNFQNDSRTASYCIRMGILF